MGYAYLFGHGVISWRLKKQQIITLSTIKAEYIAQAHAAKEGLGLCTLVSELCGKPECQITINSDNQGANVLSKDNKFHAWTKHIDVQYHFIHEAVEDEKLSVKYIPTDKNLVDIFTKP